MQTTDAQKHESKMSRENNKQYFNSFYKTREDRIKKIMELKKELITLYTQSRSPDSPITTDDEDDTL